MSDLKWKFVRSQIKIIKIYKKGIKKVFLHNKKKRFKKKVEEKKYKQRENRQEEQNEVVLKKI